MTTIELEKWNDVVTRLLDSYGLSGPLAIESANRVFGDEPTVIVAGPTGSGKTTFLNALVGASIFPEGTDHTTPVPTIIRSGESFQIAPLGPDGKVQENLPKLDLNGEDFEPEFPNGVNEIVKRLRREDDPTLIPERWEKFWGPVFDAAKDGNCACIEATAPLTWLPRGVRIVDLPGYEGWYPEESSMLHNLVLSWMIDADHAIFVMEKTKIRLGKSTQFIKHYTEQGGVSTLFITQMDQFDPYQIPASNGNGDEAWKLFCEQSCSRLIEDGVPLGDSVQAFFGAGKIPSESSPPGWLTFNILDQMLPFFKHFNDVVSGAIAKHSEGVSKHNKRINDKRYEVMRKLRHALKDKFENSWLNSQQKFANSQTVNDIHKAIGSAIENMDMSITDLWDKDKLSARIKESVDSSIKCALESHLEKALEYYLELVGKDVQDAWEDFTQYANLNVEDIDVHSIFEKFPELKGAVPAFGLPIVGFLSGTIMAVIGSVLLYETSTYLLVFTATRLNPYVAVLTIVGMVIALIFGSKGIIESLGWSNRMKTKLSEQICSEITIDKLRDLWTSMSKDIVNRTMDAIWYGTDSEGKKIKMENGADFPGLESIIWNMYEQWLRKSGNPRNT